MKLSSSIFRIVLALLLISSSLTGRASSACSGNETPHSNPPAAGYYDKAVDVQEDRYHAPQDAVLSGSAHLSATASLQTGIVHGGDGGLGIYFAPSPLLSPPTADCKMQLRRWRVLASAVRQEQLEALYPEHAFW